MKVLITAVNSQFIHASPVPWILKASCRDLNMDIHVKECSINDRFDRVAGDLILSKPDILAFSCYIWNIDYVIKLISDVKKVLPEIIIVLGGPEAEHRDDLNEYGMIIKGDGEISFRNFLAEIIGSEPTLGDPFLEDKDLYITSARDICEAGKGRIVYLETIRGCPYRCAYCLASRAGSVRQLPLELVFELIDIYMDSDVRQVKFVDRTFNVNTERAFEIIRYIRDGYSKRVKAPESWHFEVAADLFDEKLFELIETLPVGLIQFEVGVQSLNEDVLTTSSRKTNTVKVLENLKRLLSFENC